MTISRRFRLGRVRMLGFLEELAVLRGQAASVYLPPGTPTPRAEECLRETIGSEVMPVDTNTLITGSPTGAALFWGMARKCLVLPPFPLTEEWTADSYDVGPLRSLLSHDYLIALVLVRLGSYSVGISRGTALLDSKTGTGLVHARHKKGGSSQGRFARHREKQIESFLDRVCTHAREHIDPYARSVDYVVYGGARTTIIALRKRCSFLSQFDDRVLRMMLDIPDPCRAVLEKALGDVWSTTIIDWSNDD
ncbi:MAG: Vms1/Ankzf1 family peptidyl-tRNA hydrolase [Dehalococcoidia bacterium]